MSPHTTNLKWANEETVGWRKLYGDVVERSLHGEFGRDDPHGSLDLDRRSKAIDRIDHDAIVIAHLKVICDQQNHGSVVSRRIGRGGGVQVGMR